MSYTKTEVFRGSCPSCGVFQSHAIDMCKNTGCMVLHHYCDVVCECEQVLWKGNI